MSGENQIDYEAVLADLERERDELDMFIGYIKRKKLGQVEGAFNASAPGQNRPTVVPSAATPTNLTSDAFFGLSLVDATKKYLAIAKSPKTSRQICDALLAGGFKTTSKDFNNTVFSVLSREDKQEGVIAKVNNTWGLAEWYPGLKRVSTKQVRTSDAVKVGASESVLHKELMEELYEK